jgi:predicted enzyme related to lactoylglutathione lyase
MHRVIHFEIQADDPERARKFYSDVFGWEFATWEGPQTYWLITTGKDGPGINGGMMKRTMPEQPMWNIVEVASVDNATAKIEAAGGKTIHPKMEIPGVGFVAYYKDTEGTVFGVIQPAPR